MPLLLPLCIVGRRLDNNNNNNTAACPLAAVRSWNSSEKCQMPDVGCRSPHREIMTCWTAAHSGFVVLSANEPFEAFGKDSRPKHVHQEILALPLRSASNYVDHLSTFGLVGRSYSETSSQLWATI